MPDYNDQPVKPLDSLHHVEGLVSVSDRVARKEQEQKRKRQQQKQKKTLPPDPEDQQDSGQDVEIKGEDGHIDFRA